MKITVYKHEGNYDQKTCYVHARAATLSDGRLLITTQKLNVTGTDDFEGLEVLVASDGGAVLTPPERDQAFGRRVLCPRVECAECDATPMRLKASDKILAVGHLAFYKDRHAPTHSFVNRGFYAVYDEKNARFLPTKPFSLSLGEEYLHGAPGCVQFYEREDGRLFIPFTIKKESSSLYEVIVFQFDFDGENLIEVAKSNVLSYPVARGAYEPSIIFCDGKFILTVRNDTVGLYSTSIDGEHFSPLSPWCFDDGEVLENYNTQQHFLTLDGNVYLVYTRKGANNDHVFRHRAPLFFAKIDTEHNCLIRKSEQIAVPERGARLGNFGVTNVSPDLAYLTVTEWMQPRGCEKYGSDNALFIVKFEN